MKPKSGRFPDRERKLHRLLKMLRMLDNRARLTPDSLAETFHTTKRNIFRDMNDLDAAGFSITFDKENNTYCFVDPDFTLRDLELTEQELMALLLGKQIAHGLGKPFEDSFKSLLKKASKDTGTKTKSRVKNLEDRQWFWVDIKPLEGFEGIEAQYKAVLDAMDRKQELEIGYKGMHSQQETKRRIAPYGLIFSNGMWYALAFCYLRNEVRNFALDCIKEAKLTGRHYATPQDFNLDDYLKPGWRMMRYGEPVEVVLKFNKNIARWIKRRKWHPTQVVEEKKDGSIIFKVKLQGTEEIKWWTYQWAPDCEIISPAYLRKEAEEEIKALARVYEKKYNR